MAYIDNKPCRGTIMDPREYDRIADLLCQIRSKVRNNLKTTHFKGQSTVDHYCLMVAQLLTMTDQLAEADAQGLL